MAIPAPAHFTDFRVHLHNAQIDAAHLHFVLGQYLDLPENLPKADWTTDPLEEHQAWEFREAIDTFRQMIEDKPDQGNGEQPEEDPDDDADDE
jgi:hypothetical protein